MASIVSITEAISSVMFSFPAPKFLASVSMMMRKGFSFEFCVLMAFCMASTMVFISVWSESEADVVDTKMLLKASSILIVWYCDWLMNHA